MRKMITMLLLFILLIPVAGENLAWSDDVKKGEVFLWKATKAELRDRYDFPDQYRFGLGAINVPSGISEISFIEEPPTSLGSIEEWKSVITDSLLIVVEGDMVIPVESDYFLAIVPLSIGDKPFLSELFQNTTLVYEFTGLSNHTLEMGETTVLRGEFNGSHVVEYIWDSDGLLMSKNVTASSGRQLLVERIELNSTMEENTPLILWPVLFAIPVLTRLRREYR